MYNLENLSPQDFEELSCDILSKHLSCNLERFKQGKDQAIDLRLLETDQSQLIIQVKHTPGSYSSSHKSAFKKEYESFAKHNHQFSKYIFITSAKLSAHNKKEIVNLFNGAIDNENDVFGYEFIDDFLRNNPDILKQHFKLWLSNTEIISHILHSRVYGKSDDYLEELLKKKNYFVQTPSLSKGISILKRKKVLLLLGDPGVGKTMHAELICLTQIAHGYEFIYSESIDEAEDVYEKNQKQVFFIDDFMGANFVELLKENTENKIIRFINRIQNAKDKYVVLCSRTTIFNTALQRSIHLGYKHLDKKGLLLEVSNYSDLDKAKIVYNHLAYRGISANYLEIVRKTKIYLTIVKHKNFNPRLIEFITTSDLIENLEEQAYLDLIEYYLDNPGEIWRSAYENQLNDECRWLLQVLFSHSGSCEEYKLKESFSKRLKFEVDHSNHTPTTSPYENSVKILLDGFITRNIIDDWRYDSPTPEISFRNPSISDFILKYFSQNEYPLNNTINSCLYYSQLLHLASSEINTEMAVCKIITLIFNSNYTCKRDGSKGDYEEILHITEKSNYNIDLSILIQIFKDIIDKKISVDFDLLHKTLLYLNKKILPNEMKLNNLIIDDIFSQLLCNVKDFESIERLIDTAKLFRLDLKKSHLTKPSEIIIDNFCDVYDMEGNSMLSDSDDYQTATTATEVEYAVRNIEDLLNDKIVGYEFLTDIEMGTFEIDFEDIAFENNQLIYDDVQDEPYRNTEAASLEQISRVFKP